MRELALLHPQNIAAQGLLGVLRSWAEGGWLQPAKRVPGSPSHGGFTLPSPSELLSRPPFLRWLILAAPEGTPLVPLRWALASLGAAAHPQVAPRPANSAGRLLPDGAPGLSSQGCHSRHLPRTSQVGVGRGTWKVRREAR